MAGKTRTALELRVGSLAEGDLRVSRVQGREALSEPFVFDVDFQPHGEEPLDLSDLVGTNAQLRMKSDVSERFIHGIAEAVKFTGLREKRPRPARAYRGFTNFSGAFRPRDREKGPR